MAGVDLGDLEKKAIPSQIVGYEEDNNRYGADHEFVHLRSTHLELLIHFLQGTMIIDSDTYNLFNEICRPIGSIGESHLFK
ncbi:hypothetical protein ACFO3D_06795 [Virgibacillus kekensis]|uniref:Uncharacterized protein n=1 Tax=Virgibacillus kekensis TaxID=202261 RepID=A0ABV9DGK6_9BACI